METENYSSYLTGIMNMASSLSDNIGPSYIKVDCYKKNTFKEEFCKYNKIKEESLKLVETNKTLETALLDWFGNDRNLVEKITYWFNLRIAEDKKVYQSEDQLINILDNSRNYFYFLEDMLFIECNQYMIVLLLGNNE